ncbi:MAG: S8 family peptidase [Lachnospiraceae bacterium]|nr:S8 family peptidase [Lachnospiraceae bacterium]
MTCKERILSNDYADTLVDVILPEEYNYDLPIDYCFHRLTQEWGIAYIERSGTATGVSRQHAYSLTPKCYGLMEYGDPRVLKAAQNRNLNTLSMAESGILAVQREPLDLTGKNVTIGFIDTGIRYRDPVFRDFAGRSRIVSIWDQTIQTGMPPEGFEYGSEYTNEMINEALASENPLEIVPSTDPNGHGSVMASLAAGSSIENGSFTGAAPDCQIAVVKLKEAKQYLKDYYKIPPGVPCYSESDILQAIQYLQKYALLLTRPLVICLGIGTSLGDHTGGGMLGNYIDFISKQKSRVSVIAGGNEGNTAHHFFGKISAQAAYQDVEVRVGEGEKGFIMDLWGDAPYFYNATIRTPGGEIARWNNPRSYIPQEFTFVYEKTRIVIEYQLVESLSGAEVIRFRFSDPTQGIWNIRINSEGNTIGGQFDMWLPISDFLTADTHFLEPSPYTTITEPSYVHSAVSVAGYQIINDSIAASSGRGFARDNYVVPDIAAPGVNISTPFGDRSGTSVAAAITAGGCAQLMEWAVVNRNDILANSVNIKNYLIRGATRDGFMEYPNREWGYGRLNVSGVFEFLAGIGRGM